MSGCGIQGQPGRQAVCRHTPCIRCCSTSGSEGYVIRLVNSSRRQRSCRDGQRLSGIDRYSEERGRDRKRRRLPDHLHPAAIRRLRKKSVRSGSGGCSEQESVLIQGQSRGETAALVVRTDNAENQRWHATRYHDLLAELCAVRAIIQSEGCKSGWENDAYHGGDGGAGVAIGNCYQTDRKGN